MADILVDNAPEMKADDPAFLSMLATAKSDKEPAKTDVKEGTGSSPVAEVPTPDNEEPNETDYEARIKGLQAELGRRKGNAERVEQLEQELSYLKGQLDVLVKTKTQDSATNTIAGAIQKLSDEDLIGKQTDWEEELSSLRSKYDRAEEVGNSEAMSQYASKIAYAKQLIKAMKVEDKARSERKRTEQAEQVNTGQVLEGELTSMFDTVTEQHPDFKNPESDLWKAGQAEFAAYPLLMEKLGPAAQVVAAAMAIVKHPELAGVKGTAEVRRETLSNIDSGLKKALHKGGGSAPSTGRVADYNIDSGEGLANFNRMVDRIKGGG